MPNHNLATNVVSLPQVRERSHKNKLVAEAQEVFREQAYAINAVASRINGEYSKAVELLMETRGHVVVSGMGKSGLVGQKMAATFASTGTPSFFVHPGEAYHGDLGMITKLDAVLLISNSGETEEVIRLIPYLKQLDITIVSFVDGGL